MMIFTSARGAARELHGRLRLPSWFRSVPRRSRVISGSVLAIGAGFLFAAWAAQDYAQTALADLGSTILLAVPIVFLGRVLSDQLGQVRAEARSAVANVGVLREEVADVQVRMGELDGIAHGIFERQSESDRQAVQAFRDRPGWTTLGELMRLAQRIRAITQAGARVDLLLVSGDRLRVQLVDEDINNQEHLELIVEEEDGSRINEIEWFSETPMDEVVERLVTLLQASGCSPGGSFPAQKVFESLADLLERAIHIRRNGISPGLGSILEIPNLGQWAVTTLGVESLPGPSVPPYPYTVRYSRLDEEGFFSHVVAKPWVVEDDFEEAFHAARALSRQREWWFVAAFEVEQDVF